MSSNFRNKFLKAGQNSLYIFTVHYHYTNDEMGSCSHILDDRKILNQYEYDVWGNVVSQKETIKNRFKFNGQYHYTNDEMGSCSHILDDRKILNQYEYDVWGNVVSQKETIKNRFKFNGQQLDPITQQYYLRARFYNPVIGRFTQEDTYRGDGLNLYAYCVNNPIYYVDPSGNECDPIKKSFKDALECNERATEINNIRGDWESRNGTTAVMKALDNETGQEVFLVSTNASNKKVPKSLQGALKENELYIGGKGHAEETIMKNKTDRYTIIAGGTSRNICKDICKPLLEEDGLTLGGKIFRGRKDKTPFRQFWRK